MTTFSATVHTRINTTPALAFQHIAPIDPRALFTGYGPLLSVTGTRDQTGAWDTPGQTRTVALSDGSSAQEAGRGRSDEERLDPTHGAVHRRAEGEGGNDRKQQGGGPVEEDCGGEQVHRGQAHFA